MLRTLAFAAALALIALAACSDDATAPQNRFSAEDRIVDSVPLLEQATLALEGINGTVTITGSSSTTTVEIDALCRVRSSTQEDADRRIHGLDVSITTEERVVVVRTEQPQDTEGREYRVDYTIGIPEDLPVGITNVNGVIELHDLRAMASASTVNGDVVVEDHRGDLTVRVTNGVVDAEAELVPDGVLDLRTTNGAVTARIPKDTDAEVDGRIVNGRVAVTGLGGLTVTDTAITGRLGEGGGSIVLRVTNGNLNLIGT